MRNVIVRIITIVAAMTIRATKTARPGYGASSSLRKSRSQTKGWGHSARVSAAVVISSDPESGLRQTHQLETDQEGDSARAHERGILMPDEPNSEFAADWEGQVADCRRYRDLG